MLSKKTSLVLVLSTFMILFFSGLTVSEANAADYRTSPPDLEWLKFVNVESELYLDDDVIILNAADGGYYLVYDNTNHDGFFVVKTDATGTVEGQYSISAPAGRYLLAESATLCIDGSIALLAIEHSGLMQDSSIFLMKLKFQKDELTGEMVVDPASVLTKSFTPPSSGYIEHRGYSISATSDDGFIIGGDAARFFTDLEYDTYERAKKGQRKMCSSPYLMRLDSNFNLLWHKVYFDNWNEEITTLQAHVDDVQQTSDGGFIASASTYMHFTNNIFYQQYGDCIFKIDASGALQWVRFTDVEFSGPHINGTRILETRDGDFLGSTHRLKELKEVGLVKFNSNGQKLWEKYYTVEDTNTWAAVGLVEDSDGGYIAVGLSQSGSDNTFVLKVDSSGNKLWELRGPASILRNLSNIGKGAVAADDGGIVVAGVSQLPPVTAPPTATPAGGMKPNVPEGTLARLSTATSGAVIHYTTDGSTPDSSSPTGNSVLIRGEPGEIITVKAIAVKEGMLDSDMAVFTYTIASTDSPVAAPEADPAGGVVADETRVTLTSSTSDAFIYYTLDGSNPDEDSISGNSVVITGEPGEVVTLKAVAIKKDDSTEEDLTSDIATFTYTIETPRDEDDYAIYLLKLRTGLKVELTTSYNSENETLDIEATAICPVYPGDGTVTGENALSAVYQVVDGEGESLLSGELEWNPARGQWEALNVDVSGVLSELAAVEVSFEDDHHHTGFGRSSLVYGDAKLGVSSYYVMPGGNILVYATLTGLDGQRDTSGKADLSVRIAGSGEKYRLSDGAFHGDLAAQDGVYSCTLQIPGQVPAKIELELYLGNDLVDSEIVNVTSKPELAVITDFNGLYAEFRDTGMEDGEDENNNDIADFYDLLECLASYAGNYNGVVYNLSQEIVIEDGSRSYESLNYENPADRSLAGELIDSFIGDISRQKSIKNIAIIGDDQVVPFFRRIDPTLNIDGDGKRWEEEYYDDMSGGGQNPTIVDSDRGMIMTDVPYGSYDNVDPDNIKQPRLDAAVGRVFADKPSQLIEIINAYCTPISLHNAAIFQLDADTVDWPVQVQVTLMPVLTKYFSSQGNIADSPNFAMDKVYLYDPTNCPGGWTATDVTTALQKVYLNMLWTHCNHMIAGTYPKENNPLTSQDLDAMVKSPGHVMISTGCHSGYSIAHDSPVGNYDYYYKSLVRSMLAKEISYIAPSTYGIGYNQYVAYHDLLLQRFLDNLLDPSVSTVGEAHKKAYQEYWQRIQPLFKDYFNTYAAYGTVYYGLPTQPINHGFRSINTLSTVNTSENNRAAQSSKLEKIIIDPSFEVSDLEDGSKRFSVNEGDYSLEAFAPVMPLIVKEIELPLDTFVKRVNLSNYTTSEYPGPVDLEVAIPVNKSKGPVTGTYELPDTYPESIYWWETYEEDDHLKLVLSVIPMQYNKDTRKVTLYEQLEFEIDTGSGENELWAWGANWGGQLGDGSTEKRISPTRISPEDKWKALAAANARTLALKEDGTLWMWGYDSISNLSQTAPVQIGSDNDWTAIAAGFDHNLALKTDGTLWAWGGNWAGQLGDGTFNYQSMPTQISDYSDWVAIAAGETHSIAIREDGSLWAWGLNDNGQLGDGSFESKVEPTRIGSDSDWRAVAAGSSHNLALKADGSLWAWGNNWSGQLGNGTEEGRITPTQIGSDTDWAKVFANNTQSMAIKSDGSLWIWGDDGNSEKLTIPSQVGNEGGWTEVAIGEGYTIALKSDGSLWGWGRNEDGQLGDGSTVDRIDPTRIASENIWKAVAAGSAHSVALTGQTESIDECFIATAAFGSKLTPAVKLLRQFRDIYLLTNGPGQTLVKMYYTYSPPVAQVIAGSEGLKLMVRILLLPVIALAWLIMNTWITIFIVAILAAMVIIRRQRRNA
jgi:alpha-tubulin suppressor-like RCC1 family protein